MHAVSNLTDFERKLTSRARSIGMQRILHAFPFSRKRSGLMSAVTQRSFPATVWRPMDSGHD
jgi:hypothetical protein